jgi:hypothetical protein
MKHKDIHVEPGDITHRHSSDEVSELLALWLDAFGKNRHGVNSNTYLWHIFSGDRYPNVSGAEALTQYKQQQAPEYVVLSNDRKVAFATDSLPEKCSLHDYYVFPRNLAWTMAITHEDGWLGPFFARHASFTVLNDANLASLKKTQEAEAARLKGWR